MRTLVQSVAAQPSSVKFGELSRVVYAIALLDGLVPLPSSIAECLAQMAEQPYRKGELLKSGNTVADLLWACGHFVSDGNDENGVASEVSYIQASHHSAIARILVALTPHVVALRRGGLAAVNAVWALSKARCSVERTLLEGLYRHAAKAVQKLQLHTLATLLLSLVRCESLAGR